MMVTEEHHLSVLFANSPTNMIAENFLQTQWNFTELILASVTGHFWAQLLAVLLADFNFLIVCLFLFVQKIEAVI